MNRANEESRSRRMLSENLAKFGKSRLTTPLRSVTNVASTPQTMEYDEEVAEVAEVVESPE